MICSLSSVMSFSLDLVIDGPRVAARQVRGLHRIMVIRHAGTRTEVSGGR